MTVAFVISAYQEPRLLARLVGSLEGRPCAVHIDAKVDAAPMVAALASGPRVTMLPRHLCHWGLFGHVAASLEGLRWFLRDAAAAAATHVVLLTGRCYPLRPIGSLEDWLATLGDVSVLTHDAFPHPRWMDGGAPRIARYHVRLMGRAWHLRVMPQRRVPGGRQPFGGLSYWCLSRDAARLVVATVDAEPGLVRFFRHVWIPDETFFQTILANSPLRDRLVNDDIHYAEWVPHRPNPNWIADPTAALASGKWFARKFDDEAVLDTIDAARAKRVAAPARAPVLFPAR